MALTSSQAVVRIVGDESPAIAALKRFNTAAEHSQRQFGDRMGAMGISARGAAVAIGAIGSAAVALGVKAVWTAAESEAIWKKLEGTVNNTGVSFGAVRGEVERTANELQKFTRFGDEETAGVLQRLVAVTGDYRKSLANVETVMDVSVGTGMDLNAAANLVGKGIIGVTSEFRRYGIVLKDGQSATDALREKFGGLAREDGKTLQAQMERITDATDDLFEAFGKAITGKDAASSIGGIADAIKALADTIEANKDEIHKFFESLARNVTEGPANWRVGAAAGDWVRRNIVPDALTNRVSAAEGAMRGFGGAPVPLRLPRGATTGTATLPPAGDGLPAAPGRIGITSPTVGGTRYPADLSFLTGPVDMRRAGYLNAGGTLVEYLEGRLGKMEDRGFRARSDFRGRSDPSDIQRISAGQWLGAASGGAQLLAGMATGRTSALGGLSGAAGIAGGLMTGPAGIALQGVSIATSLVEGIFGSREDRKREMHDAHLRALRDARREQMTVIRVVLPAGTGKPDYLYMEALKDALIEMENSNMGSVQWQFTASAD